MATLNIHNETNIKVKGTRTCGVNKPVICIDTGEIFASVTDAAEHFGTSIYNISNAARGAQKTARGKRFCFVSRATENLEALTSQIIKLNADAEDARRWREYQAEQERIRREEEERIRAEQERIRAEEERARAEQERIEKARHEHEMKVIKLSDKLARRNRIVEKLEAELAQAIAYRDEAATALREANEEEVA